MKPGGFNIGGDQHRTRLSRQALAALTMIVLCACAVSRFDPTAKFEPKTPTTIMEAPEPDPALARRDPRILRGKYLVELLGCGSCHTDGALIGQPDSTRRLAGSHIGIAYSDPLQYRFPGVVYPPNLTPDLITGIGRWQQEEIVAFLRSGTDRHGRQGIPVMPFGAYAKLSDADAGAIAVYLRSLPPVSHEVPSNVPKGKKANAPYVHFGVYMSRDLVE